MLSTRDDPVVLRVDLERPGGDAVRVDGGDGPAHGRDDGPVLRLPRRGHGPRAGGVRRDRTQGGGLGRDAAVAVGHVAPAGTGGARDGGSRLGHDRRAQLHYETHPFLRVGAGIAATDGRSRRLDNGRRRSLAHHEAVHSSGPALYVEGRAENAVLGGGGGARPRAGGAGPRRAPAGAPARARAPELDDRRDRRLGGFAHGASGRQTCTVSCWPLAAERLSEPDPPTPSLIGNHIAPIPSTLCAS